MTAPGMLNAMVAGLEGIPVYGNPEVSHINYPVNGPLTLTGQIVAYDALTGRMQVECDWDRSATKLRFHVWARYRGQEGIPSADEVVVGEFCDFDRVGPNNTAGSGIPAGYELYTTDPTKMSWVSFFFKRMPVIPAQVLAATPGSILVGTPAGRVYTQRNSAGLEWLETNLRILKTWNIFTIAGAPFGQNFTTFPEKVIIREDDILTSFRDTTADCTGVERPPKIYRLQVIPGAQGENPCWVFVGEGNLTPRATSCCPSDGETIEVSF